MKRGLRWTALLVLVSVLLPLNAGCDDFLRDWAGFFDEVGDELDHIADDWRDRHDDDDDFGDWIDDIVRDVEDWFD